jgi:hypothetical protein
LCATFWHMVKTLLPGDGYLKLQYAKARGFVSPISE